MVVPIILNIYKTGSANSGWSGETKMVTILVQDKGLEDTITKNVTPLRWPQPGVEEPETKILDLKIPPVHAFEITGMLEKCIQTLTSSSSSAGSDVVIQVSDFKAHGFSAGSASIASPDGGTTETITISSVTTTTITVSSLSNNYAANSVISQKLSSSPKSEMIAIARDVGTSTLVYRSTAYTIAFSKLSFKDVGPIEEQYETKISVFEGVELT